VKTGRPPKPTALKELAGNPGKRPLNRREPKPRVTIPRAPAWLSADAKREYNRVARLLVGLRVMTEADATALALYAREYERYIHANKMIDETGEVVRGKGSYYQSPWLHTANQAFKNLKAMLMEFGLTPASRTRISAMPEPEETRTLAEQLFSVVAQDER
jgi:P27 family predicted phage terminase small subunit